MTLTQLEYIIAVEQEKNFHRAAKRCHVTQPTLSAMVKKLEEELGVMIFDRSKSPTQPTRVGRLILDQARNALIECQRIQEVVRLEKTELQGELKVGVIPTIAPYLLPLILAPFKKAFSKINLSVFEFTTENCLLALDREELDLAILATHEDPKKYFQEPIYNEKMLLYVNPSHPLFSQKSIQLGMLKADQMWLLEEGHCLRDEIIKLCQLRKVESKRPFDLDIKIGSLESIRYLVQENGGYTLLPELATLRLSRKEKAFLRPFLGTVPSRLLSFTTRRKYLRKALIDALQATVTKSLKEHLT